MAEQLAFKERIGEGRAVNGHERLVVTLTLAVDGTGGQLLAGTGLPPNQYGGGGRCHLMNQLHDFSDPRVGADNQIIPRLPIQLPLHQLKFLYQPPPLFHNSLHSAGKAHINIGKPLKDGDRMLTAGIITTGPAIKLIPLGKLIG